MRKVWKNIAYIDEESPLMSYQPKLTFNFSHFKHKFKWKWKTNEKEIIHYTPKDYINQKSNCGCVLYLGP